MHEPASCVPDADAASTAGSAAPAVALRAVRYRVPADGRELLRGIDLTVPAGGVLTLVGPSGAGKSTLLRLVNRLAEASTGTVAVLGRPVADWPVRELRRRVALVFQEPSLLGRTVRENLALPFRLAGGLPADFDTRAADVLERMELPRDVLPRAAEALSVGQKQRVALARSLLTEPAVLLLDEPTAALDEPTAQRLLQQLAGLNRHHGLTLLLVSHRVSDADIVGGRVGVLMAGSLAAEGELEALRAHPPTADVAAFLCPEGPAVSPTAS